MASTRPSWPYRAESSDPVQWRYRRGPYRRCQSWRAEEDDHLQQLVEVFDRPACWHGSRIARHRTLGPPWTWSSLPNHTCTERCKQLVNKPHRREETKSGMPNSEKKNDNTFRNVRITKESAEKKVEVEGGRGRVEEEDRDCCCNCWCLALIEIET